MVRIIALLMLVACTLLGARSAHAWVYEPNANITSIVFEPGDTIGDVCVQLKNAARMPVIPERHQARWQSQVRWCIDQTLAINKLTYATAHYIPVGAVLQFPHLPPDALPQPSVAYAAPVSIDVGSASRQQVVHDDERRELQDELAQLQRSLDDANAKEHARTEKVDANIGTLQQALALQTEELRTVRLELAAIEDLRTALNSVNTSVQAYSADLSKFRNAATLTAAVLALFLPLCLGLAISALLMARATRKSITNLATRVDELADTSRVASATV